MSVVLRENVKKQVKKRGHSFSFFFDFNRSSRSFSFKISRYFSWIRRRMRSVLFSKPRVSLMILNFSATDPSKMTLMSIFLPPMCKIVHSFHIKNVRHQCTLNAQSNTNFINKHTQSII